MPAEPCPRCIKLLGVTAELVQTIENLLEANRDAAARAVGPYLPEIFRIGLRATLAKVRADLAELAL